MLLLRTLAEFDYYVDKQSHTLLEALNWHNEII